LIADVVPPFMLDTERNYFVPCPLHVLLSRMLGNLSMVYESIVHRMGFF